MQHVANAVAEPATTISSIQDSEQYCQALTRREAGNFYWGFIALPKRQRVGIYSLYSFSRQVDDAVDMTGDPALALAACRLQRQRIDRLYDGADVGSDPVLRVLSETVRDFDIPPDELSAVVRGAEMDLENTRYQTWAELERYTYHVASAVGQMTTRIFGFSDPVALEHAATLGTALQITNILRDVKEDLNMGRVYLPHEDLERFGVSEDDLGSANGGPGWQNLVEFEIARARQFYADGLKVADYLPRRAIACVFTMAGLYSRILDQIEADPLVILRQRTRLRKRTKVRVMLGSWLRAV